MTRCRKPPVRTTRRVLPEPSALTDDLRIAYKYIPRMQELPTVAERAAVLTEMTAEEIRTVLGDDADAPAALLLAIVCFGGKEIAVTDDEMCDYVNEVIMLLSLYELRHARYIQWKGDGPAILNRGEAERFTAYVVYDIASLPYTPLSQYAQTVFSGMRSEIESSLGVAARNVEP